MQFNEAGADGGVIDAHYSAINISNTTCFGNKAKELSGSVLDARMNTKIWMHSSKIENNSGICLMSVIYSVLDVRHSQINGNYVFNAAICITNNSLSVLMNLSVVGNTGYQAGSIVIKDSVTYLENCTLRGNAGKVLAAAIAIFSSDLKLSKTVFIENRTQGMFLKNKAQNVDLHYFVTSKTKLLNKLHTYRCDFPHGNVTFTSDIINFDRLFAKYPFLDNHIFYDQIILELKETQFASSKDFLSFSEFVNLQSKLPFFCLIKQPCTLLKG